MAPDERSSNLDSRVLQALVAGTAAPVGEAFFDELVRHLSTALGTTGAWVTEWLPETRRLRALAFWFNGGPFGEYEYAVAGTPCEPVIDRCDLLHVPDRVVELFPADPDLVALNAVSYMGVPLLETDGSIVGHLAVLDDKVMPESSRAVGVFRVFAERAAGELRRLRRDIALQSRERRLSTLVESAMDAIVELDESLRVCSMNSAGRTLFGYESAAPEGLELDRLLADGDGPRVRRLAGEGAGSGGLESTGDAVWFTEGLTGRSRDGASFPAEGTLSRYRLDDRDRFILILRSTRDRRESEARIRALADETASLRAEVSSLLGFHEIIGRSAALRTLLEDVERVADSGATVLLTGETGTGKELVARAIHQRSARRDGPLVKVNCAAIATSLQESELFGHVAGAFTGATRDRIGRFELADGGTILLDEVGEMPAELQVKLLRVLQEGELERVGDTRTRAIDVRVIAATNRNLEQMVEDGEFRADLYFRLKVFPMTIPPLRDREDDVVLLAEAFMDRLAERTGRVPVPLTAADRAVLCRYDWPGNVRELEHVIERALLTSVDGCTLNLDRVLPVSSDAGPARPPVGEESPEILTAGALRELERANIVRALMASGWKVSGAGGAAERLEMNPSTLASRVRALGISRGADGHDM